MAIVKKVTDLNHPAEKKHLVLPAFSFATDDASATNLANMIIDAWNNVPFTFTPPGGTPITVPLGTTLVQRDANKLPTTLAKQTALARVQQAGFANLTGAVVITEVEHDNNYIHAIGQRDRLRAAGSKPSDAYTRRPGPSRYGQIAVGLYAKRDLVVAHSVSGEAEYRRRHLERPLMHLADVEVP